MMLWNLMAWPVLTTKRETIYRPIDQKFPWIYNNRKCLQQPWSMYSSFSQQNSNITLVIWKLASLASVHQHGDGSGRWTGTPRQRHLSRGNTTLCVVKNKLVRPNHATCVIFYHAFLLLYIILHNFTYCTSWIYLHPASCYLAIFRC